MCAILLDNSIIDDIETKSERLYEQKNRVIFDTMIELRKLKQSIDIITLLNKNKEIEKAYAVDVASFQYSIGRYKEYDQIIKSKYQHRKVINWSQHLNALAYDEAWIEKIMPMIKWIVDEIDVWKKEGKDFTSVSNQLFTSIRLSENRIAQYWYSKLDENLYWYKPWQLIVIWARPSVGKTTLVINLVHQIQSQEIKSAIYSLEMSNEEIVKRFWSRWSWISLKAIELVEWEPNQTHKEERIKQSVDCNNMSLITLYDNIFTIDQMILSIRSDALKNWVRIVFIDHLWLLKVKSTWNRNNDIWEITRDLKLLAKELSISIVILSQLNRSVEKSVFAEPQLSDLRDSGNIEQDADVVLMIHRPKDEDGNLDRENMTLSLRKNRNWKTWNIPLKIKLETMKIHE